MPESNLKIFCGNSNKPLAKKICGYLDVPLGEATVESFPDGETFVRINENIRGADVFIIQSTNNPANQHLMELFIMIDAARRASASRITAVIPFYGYARQDRKDQPRVPITAKLVANLIVTAGADRILTMDLHAGQIQGFFDIPMDHLYARPVFVNYLKQVVNGQAIIVSPDVGSVKMAQAYADMMNCGFAVVAKRRIDASHVSATHLVGDVEDCDCVLVDDLTTTASTLVEAARTLKEHGAKRVFAAVSHCCLNEVGYNRLKESCICELVTTDSLPSTPALAKGRIRVLSVAELLAEAMRRVHEGRSVSSLFRVVPENKTVF